MRLVNEGPPLVCYGSDDDEFGVGQFDRTCPKCGRFVKADPTTSFSEEVDPEPNATCKRCGRVRMNFCGFY